MGSVSQISAMFLIAAGLFLLSLVVVIVVIWLGRRWLIGSIHQLNKEVRELKAGESQTPNSPQVAADFQETLEADVSAGLGEKWVGLSNGKESLFPVTEDSPQDDVTKDVTLPNSEENRTIKTDQTSSLPRKQDLGENDFVEMGRLIDEQLTLSLGQVSFQAVLYDAGTQHIEIAYPLEQAGSPSDDERLRRILHTGQKLQETTQAGGCWLGVPILATGEVMGALAVQKEQLSNGFTDTHQRLLSNLARQAAIVLHSQRLAITRLQEAEQSHSLASLTHKIWTTTETDVILRTALEEIGHTLHASGGLIQLEYSIDDSDEQPALTGSGVES
jgi:hypothetical protein